MTNWGVIGLGRIAHRFVKSLSFFDDACFYAGASHTREKRNEFKEKYGPKLLYEDYTEMLKNPDIDAVYIALPHALHYEWAMKAMKAGKAVLVEKPVVLTRKDILSLTSFSKENHIFFMEAMKTRFLPATDQIHEILESGSLGKIKHIENHFTFDIPFDENKYIFETHQGGALYDTGMYNVATIMDYVKDEIIDIQLTCRRNHGVDTYDETTLTFKSGVTAKMYNSIDSISDQSMVIQCEKGIVKLNYHRLKPVG